MKLKLFIYMILVALVQASAMGGPGDIDNTFAGTGKVRLGFINGDDEASGIVAQSDGKVVVVGSTHNGTSQDFLVIRYNTDGSLDNTFDGDGRAITTVTPYNDRANGIAIQPDGKIVVVGTAGSGNGDIALVRYNTDGSLDTAFGLRGISTTPITPSTDEGTAVALQADGKIVVAGSSLTDNATADFALLRYNGDGAIDMSFGPNQNGKVIVDVVANQNDEARGVAVLPDGKIFSVGRMYDGSRYSSVFIRYNSNGHPDTSWGLFGTGVMNQRYGDHDHANAVTIQPDGKVVVVGASDNKFLVVRFTSAGLDLGFHGNGRHIFDHGISVAEAKAVTIAGGSAPKIVVAGTTNRSNGPGEFAIARLTLAGDLDTSFASTGKATALIGASRNYANGVAVHGGTITIAGLTDNAVNSDVGVARLTNNGLYDETFNGGGRRADGFGLREAKAKSIVIQPDGKTLVAGNTFTDDNDNQDFALARFNSNGSLDTSFSGDGKLTIDFGSSSDVGAAVALQADGKIVVAGSRLEPTSSRYDYAVARYNGDGSPDLGFNGTGKTSVSMTAHNDHATGVAIQPDGKIVVVGDVQPVSGGTKDFGILRLTSTGQTDGTFATGGKAIEAMGAQNDAATAVRLQPDGKVLIVGQVQNGAAGLDFGILRLTAGGIPDNTFGSLGRQLTTIGSQNEFAFGMTLQPDGKIVVAGYTLIDNTNADFAVVRYTTGGMPDPSFDNDGIVTTPISVTIDIGTAPALQPDGKIVVVGTTVTGSDADFAAIRYNTNGSLDGSFGVGGKATTGIAGLDIAWAVAVDSNGRTVLAGESDGLFGIVRLQGDFAPRKAPFDFDGDGKTDVSVVRPSAAEWWVLKSSNNGNFAVQFGAPTDKIVPADYTGDGRTDVAFFRPATGQWFVLRSEDNSYFAFPFGTNGDIPVPADYDGDGKADPAVFRPSDGHWYIYRTSDGGTTSAPFGTNGDQPVPADYDGDGKADIAIRRPSNGQWWLNRSTAGVIAYAFGTGTDKTVQGDYTGDGKADVAVWRPSTGEWFVLRSENTSFFSFPFGTSGDVPAPGDYDGDGKTDATVFRPTGATWFANRSSGGVLTATFGGAGDQPVPNSFVR